MDDEQHQQCAPQDAAEDTLEDEDKDEAGVSDADVDSVDHQHPWYQHPQYYRFWQHYAAMQSWMQMYVMMYRYGSAWYPPTGYPHMNRFDSYPPYSPHLSHNPFSNGTSSLNPNWNLNSQRQVHQYGGHTPHYHNNATHYHDNEYRYPEYVNEETDGSDESMEVEISQEMMDFFKTSQKFREERDKAKAEAEKKLAKKKRKNPVKAEDINDCKAPSERPDEGRRKEMKVLYGKHSARIHSMETAMQMQFDRSCDRLQPAFWPIVALKM